MKFNFTNSAISFLLVCSFAIPNSFAQKKMQKEFSATGILGIEIISEAIFNIEINASKTSKITVTTNVEGENYQNITVPIVQENGILKISTGLTPFFELENDKLAAHKIIAITMKLSIPENLEVIILSKIASVNAFGVYKNVRFGLDSGNCTLTNFTGNAFLQTKTGFIFVETNNNTTGKAETTHGKTNNQLPNTGIYHITAESVNGDITLLQNH